MKNACKQMIHDDCDLNYHPKWSCYNNEPVVDTMNDDVVADDAVVVVVANSCCC